MRDDAILALDQAAGGHNDHPALGLAEVAGLIHQRIMIGKERRELVGPMREHEEDVRNKAGLLLHGKNTRADVFRHLGKLRDGKAADGRLVLVMLVLLDVVS
jgi:hypothetical protein